jgi:F0F1-type ATP synthase beta subunit
LNSEGELPAIYNALKVTKETSKEIIVEVQYLIGENKAAICMTTTDGLKKRG